MSNPGNAATQTKETASEEQPKTFSDKVEAAIKNASMDEDSGKRIFPEGTPEEVEFAAMAELRRRETQSSYTKTQQTLKQKEAELDTVKKFSKPIPKIELTEEQREELEELKHSNPEAWRTKMNGYEQEAIRKAEEEHQKHLQEALTQSEIARRATVLEAFNKEHNVNITDDVIENDIPPRYKQRLENGEVTFEHFLEIVLNYTSGNKTIQKQDLGEQQPNLGKVGGGDKPTKESIEVDDVTAYENEIY